MKRYLFVLILTAGLAACGENADKTNREDEKDLLPTDLVSNPHSAEGIDTATYNKLPVMVFKDTVHDFGTISGNENATYNFSFTNEGKTPLIISNATGSCGCTVPGFKRDPIAPGAEGEITVQFDPTGKSGHQEKSVILTTNSQKGTHTLYIKADIESAE